MFIQATDNLLLFNSFQKSAAALQSVCVGLAQCERMLGGTRPQAVLHLQQQLGRQPVEQKMRWEITTLMFPTLVFFSQLPPLSI